MTIVEKLFFKGFKSFAKPVEVEFGSDFSVIIGPNGSGKCLLSSSNIILSNGSVETIGALVNKRINTNLIKNIDDGIIAQGDNTKIISLNLESNKLEEKPIKAYVKRKAPRELLKIRTKSGRELVVTKYHPLFILKEDKIEPIKAEELEEGIRIAVPRRLKISTKTKWFYELIDSIEEKDQLYVPFQKEFIKILKKIKRDSTWKEIAARIEIPQLTIKSLLDHQAINVYYLIKILKYAKYTEKKITQIIRKVKAKNQNKAYPIPWRNSGEFSRFLGYLIAEGRLSKSNQIWFTNGTREIVEDYIMLAKKLFNLKVRALEYKPNCWDVILYSSPIIKLLTKFGMPRGKTEEKDLTNLFLAHSSNEELAEFLNGYYCGDGYISKKAIEVTTKSEKLAFKINTILLRLDIIAYRKIQIKLATNSNFSGIYQTLIISNNKSVKNFHKHVKLIHKKKQERLNQLTAKKSNSNDDLIVSNNIIKAVSKELKLNLKKTKRSIPRLEAYCYNQCTPSREGLQYVLHKVLLPEAKKQGKTSLIQKLRLLADSDVLWDKIVEIEEVTGEKWVYDLSVEENHNFIANNIVAHNSNIMDAFTFVLGKTSAKSMRAERSSNLIFNGGKKGSPAREAEVSIIFSNKEKEFPISKESVKITRIVKQSGNSSYFINEEPHTKQQVIDILSKAKIYPDGHNIILQGDITSFITMKSEERRIIIEDIAGITVYEDKKQKALLELNKVEEKLNESTLILKERSTYLRELKKERDQAAKYREVETKIKENKATFIHLNIKEKQDKKEEVETKIKKLNDESNGIQTKIKEFQESIAKKKKELEQINQEIEERGEIEQITLQKELEQLKEDVIKKTSRTEAIRTEIARINQRITQLYSDEKDIKKKTQLLNEQKSKLESQSSNLKIQESRIKKQIANFKQNHNLTDFSSIEKREVQIEELQNKMFEQKEEQNHIHNLQEKDGAELGRINELLEKQLSPEAKENLQKLSKCEKELEQRINKFNVTNTQIELAQETINKKKIERADSEATKIRITESLQGNIAVNTILNAKIPGVYGTIASLGKVDQKYATALEITSGQRINSIIVDSDLTAQKGISLLKQKKAGTAIFLPLNKLKERIPQKELEQLKNFSGVRDIAVNLIKFDKKYEKAFSYVFGSTLVVDDIPIARKVGIGRARMVTLEGDIIEPSGAMIGGYRKKTAGIFEQKNIDIKLEETQKELEQLKENITKLQKQKIEENNRIEELKKEKIGLQTVIAQAQIGDISELRKNKVNLSKQIKEYQIKSKKIEEEIHYVQKEIEKLKELRRPSRSEETAKDSLEELENQQLEIHGTLIQITTELKNTQDQIATIHIPEREKIREIIKQHEKELEQFKQEQEALESELKQKKPLLHEKEKKERSFREDYKALFARRNNHQEEVNKLESKGSQEDFKVREIEKRINEISVNKARIIAELEALQLEFEPYIGTKLRRNISREDLKKEIQEAERIIKNFGNINMKALEVYETIEKEHEELVKKTESLNKEKESVLIMMTEIEGKKKRVFMKTYKEIAENFKRIFMQLSTKGDAYLDLEDKENPLNGGLNVKVRLAGTKFLDLHSLSGGEKSLTALAFIFAIQEYEPASFYLLDEVDAALDKTNSQLLSKLIANYSKSSQYIVISHNDNVITEANRVYGVSMQQNGISKIVSLKL